MKKTVKLNRIRIGEGIETPSELLVVGLFRRRVSLIKHRETFGEGVS